MCVWGGGGGGGGGKGDAIVLGKCTVPELPTSYVICITEWQGPTAHTVGAGGSWLGHFFSLLSVLSSFSSLGYNPVMD